jgi:hypothetical protein
MASGFNHEDTKHTKKAFLTTAMVWLAVEKLCRPSLREESAAAAFSCSQSDGLHGLGRVLRSSTVFRQPIRT